MIRYFKKILENRKTDELSIHELYNYYRQYNKNKLIKEIICQSQKINHNQCGVESEFKKSLKIYSKKQLIKTIIFLRVKQEPIYKKLTRIMKRNLKKEKLIYANT